MVLSLLLRLLWPPAEDHHTYSDGKDPVHPPLTLHGSAHAPPRTPPAPASPRPDPAHPCHGRVLLLLMWAAAMFEWILQILQELRAPPVGCRKVGGAYGLPAH